MSGTSSLDKSLALSVTDEEKNGHETRTDTSNQTKCWRGESSNSPFSSIKF